MAKIFIDKNANSSGGAKKKYDPVPSDDYLLKLWRNQTGAKGRFQMVFRVSEGKFKGGFVTLTAWPDYKQDDKEGLLMVVDPNSLLVRAFRALDDNAEINLSDPDRYVGKELYAKVVLKDNKFANITDILEKKGNSTANTNISSPVTASSKKEQQKTTEPPSQIVHDDSDF